MKDEAFKIKIDRKSIKIRKNWDISPETKIEKPKTDYKRSDNRSEIQRALDQEADENSGPELDEWL
jgi:hypothetical protein